jgi:hypothetical protein
MSIVSIPLAELVEDLSIYPRTTVSSVNTTNLVDAIRAGVTLPPPVVDKKSKRIVDGFHRRRAYLKALGTDATILVDLRHYKTDADILLAAIEANTCHGLPLQEIDKRRNVLSLQGFGTDNVVIARVLHVPVEKIEKLTARIVTVVSEEAEPVRVEPLKQPHRHFQGGEMSEAQSKAAKSAPGTSYLLTIRQLHDALQHRLIDGSSGQVIAALKGLAEALEGYLAGLEETA